MKETASSHGAAFDRRCLLRRAGQGSLALALGAVGASGCSSGDANEAGSGGSTTSASRTGSEPSLPSAGGTSSSGSGTVATGALPAYMKYQGVTPDIPATNPNAIDGFLSYPDPPVNAVPDKPGRGDTVTGFAQLSSVTPPPMDKNNWWQNINAQVGATITLSMVPSSGFTQSFTTRVAGGDLPELVRVPPVANLDKVLEAEFTDLTPFLAGDAIKDYPMLANIPTLCWESSVYNGKIYGVPMSLLPIWTRLEARTDVIDELGLSAQPNSADDFLSLCRGLTDAKKKRWAMAQPTAGFIQAMLDVPNQWTVDNGAFTKDIETSQYKDWLSFVKKMWDDGLFHPDSFAHPHTDTLFLGKHFVLYQVGGAGMSGALMTTYTATDPTIKVAPVAPPKASGGGIARVHLGNGTNHMTAIRKKDMPASRVKYLLGILNFLAGPFGTTQYLDTNYGAKGKDYTWKSGQGPAPNKLGGQERVVFNYIPGAPMVMYSPGFDYVTKNECAYGAKVGPTALAYPTAGLYSSTDSTKGATLTTAISNAVADVIQGHKPLSGWDGIVKTWRSGGGDTIREEYQRQYEQKHG